MVRNQTKFLQPSLFDSPEILQSDKIERIKMQTFIDVKMRNVEKQNLRYENLHLSKGMTFTNPNGFPQMKPFNGEIPPFSKIYPYTMRASAEGVNCGLHFFVRDSYFANSLWNDLERKTVSLSRFDVLFTPDYSLFVNPPLPFVNKMSIYKKCFCGAFWQLCGLNVISTASYGDVNSFSYCYEGLPENGIIAIGNETVRMRDPASVVLWQMAVRELERQKHPTLIIIYGKRIEVPGLHTPVAYFPGYIETHFRNGRF